MRNLLWASSDLFTQLQGVLSPGARDLSGILYQALLLLEKSYSLPLQFISFLLWRAHEDTICFLWTKNFLRELNEFFWDWILHHNTFMILSESLFSSTLLDKVPFWSCGWPSMCNLTISCDPLSSKEARSWICQRELPLETKGEER